TGRQSSLLDNNIETLQGYNLNNKWTGNGTGADAALNYQLGFKKDKNRLLTFSYRYFGYDNGSLKTVIQGWRCRTPRQPSAKTVN
ncbi:hypothetical protein, partial [Nostoc sp. CHAB 5715]|uniref:hypothetical protein n=1 Tax=Nostoc sp. CHAB 5715 TaxID=2780400 RepID=UPI001E2DA16C